jgi:hypothetical protein
MKSYGSAHFDGNTTALLVGGVHFCKLTLRFRICRLSGMRERGLAAKIAILAAPWSFVADDKNERPPTSSLDRSIIMFGISPLGWLHTLGSLPAIPAAAYMLARHGRIVPRSVAGAVYFIAMVIGSATVFLIAHQPVSYAIGVITLVLLLAGYGVGRLRIGRAALYIETICLSLTAFLLMLPTLTETLRRVPDGNPLVTDLNSPILLGAQTGLLVALMFGLTAQILYLRRYSAISFR